MLRRLEGGKYYLDYGPVQMVIAASAAGNPLDSAIKKTESFVRRLLEELSNALEVARRVPSEISSDDVKNPLLKKMVAAVKITGDPELTPMAAVAGAFADMVADFLQAEGATRVVVNNGGDIAFRLAEGEKPVLVGAKAVGNDGCPLTFKVAPGDGCGGVATSGLGGRGFTKGIATFVTVLAGTGSIADACATSIANHTDVDDPGVLRLPAEKLDPLTDIAGHYVTVDVKNLKEDSPAKALLAGVEYARQLLNRNVINGAIVCVAPYFTVMPDSFPLALKGE